MPLQPFLTSLALSASKPLRRCTSSTLDMSRVDAGNATLPYEFTIRTTNPVVIADGARSATDLKIATEDIELPVTLWNRSSWTLSHTERFGVESVRSARSHVGDTYRRDKESYYLQFRTTPQRVLWFGEVVATGLLTSTLPAESPRSGDCSLKWRDSG